MRLISNDKMIKRNKIIGQVCTIASLVILVGGFFLAMQKSTAFILFAYVAMIVGFILSQVGIYFTNRWGRKPRFDEMFSENLKNLSDYYTFYVYSSPIAMILVGPGGIWVPQAVTTGGEVSYANGKFKQKGGSAMLKIFAQEGIGKPELEAEANDRDIRKFLAKHMPEIQFPPINHILVCLNPAVKLDESVKQSPLPIVKLENFKRYVRHVDRETEKNMDMEKIEKVFVILEGE